MGCNDDQLAGITKQDAQNESSAESAAVLLWPPATLSRSPLSGSDLATVRSSLEGRREEGREGGKRADLQQVSVISGRNISERLQPY